MSKTLKSVDYGIEKIFEGAQDFLPLLGTDYVELYVGNAKQAAHFYKTAFGFQSLAYKGLETGSKDEVSYVLKQGKIRLVLTSPLNSKSPINDHLRKHGDGVKDIAFHVDDAKACYEACIARGAKSAREPETLSDENGSVTKASIFTYGETLHSFISHDDYNGPFLPGFIEKKVEGEDVGLKYIDHIVGNVELGKMEHWVNF